MAIDRGPWNALVDDDGSNLIGSVWNKAAIKTVILDPVDLFVANGGTWASYAPTWAGAGGTAPVLGNGALTGRYCLIGKLCHVAIALRLGSTTTVGTSTYWRLTLPQTFAIQPGNPSQENILNCGAMSAAGSIFGSFTAYADSSASLYACNYAGSLWGPTVPFAWNANSIFTVRGTYEVA